MKIYMTDIVPFGDEKIFAQMLPFITEDRKNKINGRFFSFGRSDWTRTSDLYVPNVAFYQAELHSDNEAYIYHKK